MNKFLRIIVIFLLVKVDWRKLLFFGAIFTVTAIFVQTSTLPYPLTKRNMSPPLTVSSYFKPLNGTLRLIEATPLVRNEHFEPIRGFPEVVAVDSSEKVVQSAPVLKKGVKVARNRTRRRHASATPPPPAWPSTPSRPVPGHILRRLRAMTPDEALLFAKKEIENITVDTDDNDHDLYAPLFRNVSVFKRSYELMEWILKVYIYKEGDKPIFHEPHLQGIYSSEGWFMKIMEGYRHFITMDPQKAHLFYLPYSARQLQKALYVPNSHHMKPLSIFLRDYVNMLASKYPFWNRTHGRDHFLVACHDWGPYTLTEHEELTLNTIKALCNADISEGIFKAGKDVSLPETTIRNPGKPLRNIGGKRVSQRPILAFYAGRSHGRVRPRLLRYWRNRDGSDKDPDMRINGPLSKKVSRIMSYVEHMKSSKYCICPMGFEVNSPRIVESIYYECVPVIIADNFAPPLSDVFDWSAFSVTVAEKDIPKLKEILVAIPMKKYLTMQANVKMLQRHFAWNATPVKYDMFHMILHSIWLSRLNQIQVSQST